MRNSVMHVGCYSAIPFRWFWKFPRVTGEPTMSDMKSDMVMEDLLRLWYYDMVMVMVALEFSGSSSSMTNYEGKRM